MELVLLDSLLGQETPIAPGFEVRAYDGDRWVTVSIRSGELTLQGSARLTLRPSAANVVTVTVSRD